MRALSTVDPADLGPYPASFSPAKRWSFWLSPLLYSFWAICLFQKGPQDLPASRLLWRTMLAFAFLSGIISLSLSQGDVLTAVLFELGDLALVSYFVLHVLEAQRKRSRFVQATTAIYGTTALLNFVSIPVLILIHSATKGAWAADLGLILFLGVVAWSVAVLGHIFRHAFDVPAIAGAMISFLYFILINLLVAQFIPSS